MLPQPVLIIGTYNEDGTPNAMNAAWGGQWDRSEIMISMGAHATTENLARCADFTVAFATRDTMVAADFVGIVSAKDDPQKMQKTGWTVRKSENVNAPVFTDFPMTLECRIKHKIDESGEECDLLARLAAEKEFGLTEAEMTELLTPALYIGRCPEQVSAFVEKIKPLLANADGKSAEINL